MVYYLDPVLKLGYELYYKHLNTPTNLREEIIGDSVSFFLKRAEEILNMS